MSGSRYLISDVIRVISHLGGPECSEEDLTWAADIPAGELLLEWLAMQAAPVPVANCEEDIAANAGAQPSSHSEKLHNQQLQTSLSPIALYRDEVDTLDRLGKAELIGNTLNPTPTSYKLPSTLALHSKALQLEAETLEASAARSMHRLNSAKAAAKDVKQSVRTIEAEIKNVDRTIQGQQERLTDLSLKTDGTIARCTSQAASILGISANREKQLSALKSKLASLEHARLAIVDSVGRLYQTLDDGYHSLLTVDEIRHNVAAVCARMTGVSSGLPSTSTLLAASYVEELEKATLGLRSSSTDNAARADGNRQGLKGGDYPKLIPDIHGELERSGRLDRLILLREQEKGLHDVVEDLQGNLVPRLQNMYDALHDRSAAATETEAIISALIDELEEVNDATECSKASAGYIYSESYHAREGSEDVLENAITDLLKALLGSRGDAENRPTVLLDRSDVEAELKALTDRSAAAHQVEGKWAAEVSSRLTELLGSYSPLLSAAYNNSPMNTSPPFAPSSAETAVEDTICRKVDELVAASIKLQNAPDLSSRDKRKLADVNKWALH
ncbi:hypothetical protein C8Q78DRAFT_189275 [Trametes maxima]|nr:hypothetical protein C8Q78DRAFT_189275 [Trametes maxima]